jgi:hypothetical protein
MEQVPIVPREQAPTMEVENPMMSKIFGSRLILIGPSLGD